MIFVRFLLLVCIIISISSCVTSKKVPPKPTHTVTNNPDKPADTLKIVADTFKTKQKDSEKNFIEAWKKFHVDETQPVRVAILAPLYLDSAFNGYSYNLGRTNISKFFMQGLEFYNGVTMAIDSLEKENEPVEVWIYDTKKKGQSIQSLTADMQRLKFSLVIASIVNTNEQRTLSDFSFSNNIPLISATYPNDANVSNNPFFVMLNSTWKTHLDAVCKYVQQNLSHSNLIFITKNGNLEDRILKYFKEQNKRNYLSLNYSTVVLADDFTNEDVLSHLDSTKQNTVICGTLNETFGRNLIKTLNNAHGFSNVVIGAPTWQGMPGTSGSACSNIELILTTPYNYQHSNSRLSTIAANYSQKYNARPGDMVYKGFESMYHFTKLLTHTRSNFMYKISDTSFKIVNDYKIEPVIPNTNPLMPDYLENKKIYHIKIVNGEVQSVY